MLRRLLAEALGTFCLVFTGTGAIVVNEHTGGAVTHVGVSLVFGLVVMIMIALFGGVSGAHLNPAVTAALVIARRFPAREAPAYAAAQIAGAFVASGLLRVMFSASERLGATIPSGPEWQALVLEVVLAFLLVLTVLAADARSEMGRVPAGVVIGGVVAIGALFAGPISGASMNPARSLAPAVVSGHADALWVYLLAPLLGAILAVPASGIVRSEPARRAGLS